MTRKKKKLTAEDLSYIIASEGLDYAIQHYVSAADIKDREIAELWQHAFEALAQLTCRLPSVEGFDNGC